MGGTLVWPVDQVPDATILAPHHYWIGLMVATLAIAVVWDDARHEEPIVAAVGVLVAVTGFLAWEFHPIAGAVLSHVGLLVVGLSLWSPYLSRYDWRGHRGVVAVGLLIAADDLISHAWGVWTPLDGLIWADVIVPILNRAANFLTV